MMAARGPAPTAPRARRGRPQRLVGAAIEPRPLTQLVIDRLGSADFRLRRAVVHTAHADGTRAGETAWVARQREGGPHLGIAWNWVELGPRVLALSDPASMRTTFRLVTQDGRPLTAIEHLLHLNLLVYSLGWQDQVSAALQVPTRQRARHALLFAMRG